MSRHLGLVGRTSTAHAHGSSRAHRGASRAHHHGASRAHHGPDLGRRRLPARTLQRFGLVMRRLLELHAHLGIGVVQVLLDLLLDEILNARKDRQAVRSVCGCGEAHTEQ